jgi:hypothetical protein
VITASTRTGAYGNRRPSCPFSSFGSFSSFGPFGSSRPVRVKKPKTTTSTTTPTTATAAAYDPSFRSSFIFLFFFFCGGPFSYFSYFLLHKESFFLWYAIPPLCKKKTKKAKKAKKQKSKKAKKNSMIT